MRKNAPKCVSQVHWRQHVGPVFRLLVGRYSLPWRTFQHSYVFFLGKNYCLHVGAKLRKVPHGQRTSSILIGFPGNSGIANTYISPAQAFFPWRICDMPECGGDEFALLRRNGRRTKNSTNPKSCKVGLRIKMKIYYQM